MDYKIRKPVKKVLYRMGKKANQELMEISPDKSVKGRSLTIQILRTLQKKGLVDKIPYHTKLNKLGDKYYLTDEGRKLADEIIEEIDEYKRW